MFWYARQWHLHSSVEHDAVDVRSSLRCDEAWALHGVGDPEVVVAIVDSGCRIDHPAFGGSEKFAGWGYVEDGLVRTPRSASGAVSAMYLAGQHHGTSMAGLVAAVRGRDQPVGVAPGCRLLPIRVPVDGGRAHLADSVILRVLDEVAERADVLVLPWSNLPYFLLSRGVVDRIAELARDGGRRRRGVLVVRPAGNSNCPIHHSSPHSVPYLVRFGGVGSNPVVRSSRTFRNVLASVPGVLHVSAISSTGRRAHYSCYGPGIDLCAPSSNSRAFRGEPLPGLGLTTCTGDPERPTERFKGTSGSAALVAGVAALVLSARPDTSAVDLAEVLKATASTDLDVSGYAASTGSPLDHTWDRPPIPPFEHGSFDGDGWSPWFGHGKVDAFRAVTLATAATPGGPPGRAPGGAPASRRTPRRRPPSPPGPG